MKKLSLLFAALLAVSMSFATTVTKTVESLATELSWTNGTVCTPFALDNAITVSTTATDANTGKYYSNGQQIRLYQTGSATITLTAGEGYSISSVALTYASQNTGILLDATGATYESGTDFAVNAQAVTFSVGNSGEAFNGQARITEFSVTYNAGGETPVIPVDTTVVPVDTTNAIISLADAKLLAVGTEITTTGIVTYINGKYAYIQDATDGILLYSSTKITNFQVGDEIVIDAKVARYGNAPELSNVVLRNIVSSENTVNPILMTLAERVANPLQNFGMMVTINELTITAYDNYSNPTFSDGTNTVAGYKFSMDTTAFPIGSVVDVTAIAAYYNTIQIQGDPAGVVMRVYPVTYYPVAFLDWDGTVLTRDSIACGAAATAPAAPIREGYEFLGWSKDYSNIQGEMFIIALYEQEQAPVEGILVSYIDGVDNSLIGNDTIVLNIPEAPIHEGYTFQGWMTVVGNPEDGITIQATYQNNDPTQVQQQTYVPEAGETRKVFENGKVYVVRDGKTFTMQGQEVR